MIDSNSKDLFARSKKISPGGVHSPVRAFGSVGENPVFFKAGNGEKVVSVEGREYIDFCQSFGPNILGHRDPEVMEEVHRAVDDVWTLGACEPYSLELAEWITERIPWVEKLRFVNSGTEAVMSALRLARAATGRSKILKFEGCYHGHVDQMLVQAGSGLAGQAASSSAGVSDELAKTTLVGKLDDESSVDAIFSEHGKDIAAIIIEPMPANFGLLKQRKEFLQHLEKTAKANGALLIFDEVISGFRMGITGMAGQLGMNPDLVTYGKVIGGGFPVGCYGGRKDLMSMMAPEGQVYQAGTLSANPIGMRAGLATVRKLEREKVFETLAHRMEKFVGDLTNLYKSNGANMTVVSSGSIFWNVMDGIEEEPRRLDQIPKDQGDRYFNFFHGCLENGIYLAPNGYEVGFLSLAHDQDVLDKTLDGIESALKK